MSSALISETTKKKKKKKKKIHCITALAIMAFAR
jgi:hypothetical protein